MNFSVRHQGNVSEPRPSGSGASTDVFVVGGGPAGLAAAIAARRRGFDVTLADCSIPPIDKACGEGIMPDGLAAARSLGIDFAIPGAHPFRGIRFCGRGESVAACFPHGVALGVRRTTLHQVLLDRAAEAGVRMIWGARITGIEADAVHIDGRRAPARWIVGADGGRSLVRRWANLNAAARDTRRFAFRRHYAIAPWSEYMEIHWGEAGQLYLTPVGARELCVVLISRDQHLRLDDALPAFPAIAARLKNVPLSSAERGAISASRSLKSVCRGNVALIGDASGSVDAITGEGLCLLFQQAAALADALAAGDLAPYQAAHNRIVRRARLMGRLLLLLDRYPLVRWRTLRAMASHRHLFSGMLAMHVGELSPLESVSNGLALGWHFLTI